MKSCPRHDDADNLFTSSYLVAGTPASALASRCILAALSPDDDSYHHGADPTLFNNLGVLKSVAQKVQESIANERPLVSRPAREAKELLKSIDELL